MASENSESAHRRSVCSKIVIIGDGACGKTSLLSAFKNNNLTLGYNILEKHSCFKSLPAFENYVTKYKVDGEAHHLALWDTGPQEQYERLRSLVFLRARAVILCFSIESLDSFENITYKWVEEVTRLCPGIPIVLVSLKNDLRKNQTEIKDMQRNSLRLVTELEGKLAALQIGAKSYIECSSLSGEGVNDVFEAAARAALLQSEKRLCGCCVSM